MSNPEIFFAIANLLNIIANIKNIKTLWNTPYCLKGFDFTGSCITVIVLTFMNVGFLLMNSWINVILVIPSLFYYCSVAYLNRPIINIPDTHFSLIGKMLEKPNYRIGYKDEWGDERFK